MVTLALCAGCFALGMAISGAMAYGSIGRKLEMEFWRRHEEKARELGKQYIWWAKAHAWATFLPAIVFITISIYGRGQIQFP